MIRYTKDNALTVLYWWGGINREILPKAIQYLFFLSALYLFQTTANLNFTFYTDSQLFHTTLKGILSFLVFLLVFRLNQCMSRHYAAVSLVTDLFHCLERLTVDLCLHLRGDNGESYGAPVAAGGHASSHHEPHRTETMSAWACERMALAAKVNCIRLILAYGVSMILHFQLLDAASDSNGELDDSEVEQVVFLYCRLRCLLYNEEMHLLDNGLSILKDSSGGETIYRAEVNRFRLLGDPGCEQLIGYPEKDRHNGGVTVVPAPKIIMNILMRALQRPSDQQWGYESRLWNLFWRDTLRIINVSLHLESIIMSPTPLPYLQHCRILFLLFAIAFPLSVDCSKGPVHNIFLPLVIFWAITGFEVLSASLENPLGNDEVDMNLYEKIHSLEVNAEEIFNATEIYQAPLYYALERTENLVMGEADAESCRNRDPGSQVRVPSTDPSKLFRTYFHWTPMPTLLLGDLLEGHGEVENLHTLRMSFRHLFGGFSVRKMLRQSLNRPKASDGHQYMKVENDDRPEPVVDFNKDPNYFCHYLEFVGADGRSNFSGQAVSEKCWKDRAAEMLGDHQAARLIKPVDAEDSDRSMMMQTRDTCRMQCMKKLGMSSLGSWERLA